jgi:outer membrane protein assembly factor BamA
VGHRNTGITAPRGDVSTQDRFSEFEVPALSTGADTFSSGVRFDWDTKDKDQYATAGGLRRLEVSLNTGTAASPFRYWKSRLELQQFFKLVNDPRKIIALRAAVETNQEQAGDRIPFFNLARIGSWDTVRGLDTFRYYDKSAAYYGVEYRFGIWHVLDSALFVDQGQVAPEPGDFSFRRFHTGYGARLIVLPKPDRPVSVEFGRSGNTWRLYVSANRGF